MGIHRLSNRLVRVALASRLFSRTISLRLRLVFTAVGRMPSGATATMAILLPALAPHSVLSAAKNRSAMHLPSYKAVPVYYRPLNKMIMSVRINAQPASLLVDTAASQTILDKDAAESVGV